LKYLLDASAVLAALKREPGWERVIAATPEAAIGAANWAEVIARLSESSDTTEVILEGVATLGMVVLPVDEIDGIAAGFMRQPTKAFGLSLGDRLCLAMANRRGLTVIASDRAFAMVSDAVQVEIELIR
jgi:PIN domain nuclease of toxin-antitoxin system